MRHNVIGGMLVFAMLSHASLAWAETCPRKDASTNEAGKSSEPAAVSKDGVGATDTSGGHGGLSAGLENQTKQPPPETSQPEEAKGLDLKMKTPQQQKC